MAAQYGLNSTAEDVAVTKARRIQQRPQFE